MPSVSFRYVHHVLVQPGSKRSRNHTTSMPFDSNGTAHTFRICISAQNVISGSGIATPLSSAAGALSHCDIGGAGRLGPSVAAEVPSLAPMVMSTRWLAGAPSRCTRTSRTDEQVKGSLKGPAHRIVHMKVSAIPDGPFLHAKQRQFAWQVNYRLGACTGLL
jgi:hypothetical protein